MKSTKQFLTVITIFFMCIVINAQSDRYQLYVVHEDHVKDGMEKKHEQADKAILDAAKEHKMKDMNWITFQADDNRVMYLSPIESMAELDKNPFEDLQKKMGADKFDALFEPYAGTYTKHGDYILRLDKELSYMPQGITQTPEGQNYRELTYYHIPPGQGEKAEQLAQTVKQLYTKKNSKLHYRLYKSGFGNMGNYFMVAVAAESPEALEKLREENMELLGEEGKKIFDEIQNATSKQERVTGYLRPELSYVTNN
ncbi:hypothetical protein [Gramella sp. KN1008]|uniref:hypothetical protein n=1 Tax=Gramella sp. KN1008 TaxID=2529298 RepID=UPI00103B89D1|nr:hypothetical protein [Gramella sp. KN1008]TBW28917.1 hypothetical protein EZJ28_03280 [Gramella sp. KN1008]